MPLTAKQAHVLSNFDRVRRRYPKVELRNPSLKYDLDGKDCSYQIRSLVVLGQLTMTLAGSITRPAGPSRL